MDQFTDAEMEVQYLQQYLYLGIGWFSVVSSLFGVALVAFTKRLRTKHPAFLAIYISGFVTALSFVIMGFTRLDLLGRGTFFQLIHPSECLKRPGVILHFTGSQMWNVFHCLTSMERLLYVAFPDTYVNYWNESIAKTNVIVLMGIVLVSLSLGAVATLSFSATGQMIQARCALTDVTGPTYGIYHFSLCTCVSSLSVLFGLISLGLVKYKLDGMKSNKIINPLIFVLRSSFFPFLLVYFNHLL